MKTETKQLTLIALFLALCVVVPLIFHIFGAGAMFLPMFIPIFLAGFFVKFPAALLVGVLGPLISAVATGMPPLFPTAIFMSAEGMVATGVVSYLYQRRHLSYWICLISGIIAERLLLLLMILLVAPLLGLPPKMFSVGILVYSLPGVILQLTIIPLVLNSIWKLNRQS